MVRLVDIPGASIKITVSSIQLTAIQSTSFRSKATFKGYLTKPAKREYDVAGTRLGVNNKLFYLTFPVYRKPPPRTLLTNKNVEWIETRPVGEVMERPDFVAR